MSETTQTVMLYAPSEVSRILFTNFDWRENVDRVDYIPVEPGTTYFVNVDGQAYDYVGNDSWETIQNFCTDCHSVIVVAEDETPTEADFRAYDVAVHERELYADCFGN